MYEYKFCFYFITEHLSKIKASFCKDVTSVGK